MIQYSEIVELSENVYYLEFYFVPSFQVHQFLSNDFRYTWVFLLKECYFPTHSPIERPQVNLFSTHPAKAPNQSFGFLIETNQFLNLEMILFQEINLIQLNANPSESFNAKKFQGLSFAQCYQLIQSKFDEFLHIYLPGPADYGFMVSTNYAYLASVEAKIDSKVIE